jgi:sialidase-1
MSVRSFARRLVIVLGISLLLPLTAGAANGLPLFESDELACYRIPAIVSNNQGVILAAVEQRFNRSSVDYRTYDAKRSSGQLRRDGVLRCSDAGFINIVARRSTDYGATWSDMQLILDHRQFLPPHYRVALAGNPTFVFIPESNRFLLLFSVARSRGSDNSASCVRARWSSQPACRDVPAEQGIWMTTSDDLGESWSAPQPLNLLQPKLPELQRPGPGHGIILPSGRVVVPAYPNLLVSDDGGLGWRYGGPNPVGNETSVVLLDDGSIWSSIRVGGQTLRDLVEQNGPSTWRFSGYSSDRGETYERLGGDERLLVPQVHLGLLRIEATRTRPATIVASFPSPRLLTDPPDITADRRRLLVAVSDGTGGQFRGRFVHAGPAGYSDLAYLDPRRFGVLYEGAMAIEPLNGASSYSRNVFWKTIGLAAFDGCIERGACFALSRPLPRRVYD